MKLSYRLLAGTIFAAVVLAAGTAAAAPGIASVNANVRAGAGTNYKIVDRLTKGEYVIVKDCSANWCEISHIGNDGYVARSLLYNPYYGSRNFYQFPPKRPVPGR